MKDRIKFILLGFFIIIILFLTIYTIKREPDCDRIHIDEMIAFDVPDEETAREIADVVMGFGEEKDYDVAVDFDKKSGEWIITYLFEDPLNDEKIMEQKVVRIRKDTGTITVS